MLYFLASYVLLFSLSLNCLATKPINIYMLIVDFKALNELWSYIQKKQEKTNQTQFYRNTTNSILSTRNDEHPKNTWKIVKLNKVIHKLKGRRAGRDHQVKGLRAALIVNQGSSHLVGFAGQTDEARAALIVDRGSGHLVGFTGRTFLVVLAWEKQW
jgi:hypothetical protein